MIYFELLPCVTGRNCVNRLGTWNMRRKNGIVVREVTYVFRKGKFELFVLTETNMKGNGEVSW